MTAQSWVETTLPPGYAAHVIRPGVHEFFFADSGNRWGYTSHAETCRAAWRHWTAAVLRGRGDVRAKDYSESGGIGWRLMYDGLGRVAGCERVYVAKVDDDVWGVAVPGGTVFVSDVDEAMARFAASVLANEGPVAPKRGEG